jgi:hypothetical protein
VRGFLLYAVAVAVGLLLLFVVMREFGFTGFWKALVLVEPP